MISYYLARGGIVICKKTFEDGSTQHVITQTDDTAYLKWLDEGNTPEPADQPAQA